MMRDCRSSSHGPRLRSAAWLLRGISSIPGELALGSGLVSFSAQGTGSAWPWQLRRLERELAGGPIADAIDQGERTLVFAWPVREVRAWCPWYYFGGGLKLERAGIVLRLSFGQPGNLRVRGTRTDPVAALQGVAADLKAVRTMRGLGAQWLAALEGAAAGRDGT